MYDYQAMCDAAAEARNEFLSYRDRCFGYFGTIIKGLIEHCGVPKDQLIYLRWNGLQGESGRYSKADSGAYLFHSAAVYDESDGTWRLCIQMVLTAANTFPKQHVTFVLFVAEQNGSPTVKIDPNGKPQVVHLHNVAARNAYCETITEQVMQTFSDPKKPTPKPIGFDIGMVN
jgi:hypothetical protein